MSKYSSKNHVFQFGLLLFLVMGLSIGIILTNGKASLNLFSSAAGVEIKYGGGDPTCAFEGGSCVDKECCGGLTCGRGVCVKSQVGPKNPVKSTPMPRPWLGCDPKGSKCGAFVNNCCPGSRCNILAGVCK